MSSVNHVSSLYISLWLPLLPSCNRCLTINKVREGLERRLRESLCQVPQLLLVFQVPTTIYKKAVLSSYIIFRSTCLLNPLLELLTEKRVYECWAGSWLPSSTKIAQMALSDESQSTGRVLPCHYQGNCSTLLSEHFQQGWFYTETYKAIFFFF